MDAGTSLAMLSFGLEAFRRMPGCNGVLVASRRK
jgi:hypothetical protein